MLNHKKVIMITIELYYFLISIGTDEVFLDCTNLKKNL